jgi:hypothetical protein
MAPQAAAGDSLTLPTALHSGGGSNAGAGPDKSASPLRHFRRWASSSSSRRGQDDAGRAAAGDTASEKWWKIHLFRGMVNDIRRRAPYYWSDWRDAWDYRVVPATIYMYFAK